MHLQAKTDVEKSSTAFIQYETFFIGACVIDGVSFKQMISIMLSKTNLQRTLEF